MSVPEDTLASTAELPASLTHNWRREEAWLADLPGIATRCASVWGLVLERPIDTPHSLVIPAGDVVLKINAPSHFEADHEADALRAWDGQGAVRLVARDDTCRAFLIERCQPGTRLWDAKADVHDVIVDIVARVTRPAPQDHPFRLLADECDRWVVGVCDRYEQSGGPFERAILDVALDTFESVDRAADWLVNQDLHGGNILASRRDGWLAIDPKPIVGERELDAVGLLRNEAWNAGASGIRRLLDALMELGLDRDRMRAWSVAHALAWAWEDETGWSAASIEAARIIHDA